MEKRVDIYGRPPPYCDEGFRPLVLIESAKSVSASLVLINEPISSNKADLRADLHKLSLRLVGGCRVAGLYTTSKNAAHVDRMLREISRHGQPPAYIYAVRGMHEDTHSCDLFDPQMHLLSSQIPIKFVSKAPPTMLVVNPMDSIRLLLHGAKSAFGALTVSEARKLVANVCFKETLSSKSLSVQIVGVTEKTAQPLSWHNDIPTKTRLDALMLNSRKSRRALLNYAGAFVLWEDEESVCQDKSHKESIRATWWAELPSTESNDGDTVTLDFVCRYTAACLCFSNESVGCAQHKLLADRLATVAYRLTMCSRQAVNSGLIEATNPSGVARMIGASRSFLCGSSSALGRAWSATWNENTIEIGRGTCAIPEDFFGDLADQLPRKTDSKPTTTRGTSKTETGSAGHSSDCRDRPRNWKLIVALLLFSVSVSSLFLQASLGQLRSPFLTWLKTSLFRQVALGLNFHYFPLM